MNKHEIIFFELKFVETLTEVIFVQALNCLKATGLGLEILLGFAKAKLGFFRVVK